MIKGARSKSMIVTESKYGERICIFYILSKKIFELGVLSDIIILLHTILLCLKYLLNICRYINYILT